MKNSIQIQQPMNTYSNLTSANASKKVVPLALKLSIRQDYASKQSGDDAAGLFSRKKMKIKISQV